MAQKEMNWILEVTRDTLTKLPAFKDWDISNRVSPYSASLTITNHHCTYDDRKCGIDHGLRPKITVHIIENGIITVTGSIKTTPIRLDIANPTTTPESIIAAIQHHQHTILNTNLRWIT